MSSPRPLTTVLGALAAVCVATLLLSGCGSGSGSGSGNAGHHEAAISAHPLPRGARPSGHAIDITIQDRRVTPDGERVHVDVGQPLTLVVDADAPGELHVHSSPERHIEYPAGRSRVRLTLDQPGIVDVESHTLDKLIVQLEVR